MKTPKLCIGYYHNSEGERDAFTFVSTSGDADADMMKHIAQNDYDIDISYDYDCHIIDTESDNDLNEYTINLVKKE